MAGESYIEDVIFDVRDYIQANVGGFIAAINAAKNDGLTVANFREFEVDDGDPLSRTVLPSMLIDPTDVVEKALTMGEDELQVTLIVVMVHVGDRQARLPLIALRSAEALRRMILADVTFGGAVGGLQTASDGSELLRFTYYPRVPGDMDRKVTTLRLTVVKDIPRE